MFKLPKSTISKSIRNRDEQQEKQKEIKKKKREANYIQFRELYIAMHRDDEGGKMNLACILLSRNI